MGRALRPHGSLHGTSPDNAVNGRTDRRPRPWTLKSLWGVSGTCLTLERESRGDSCPSCTLNSASRSQLRPLAKHSPPSWSQLSAP